MDRNQAMAIGDAMVDRRWADVLAQVAPNVTAHIPAVGCVEGVDGLATFLLETGAKADDGEHFELLDTLVGEHFVALYFRITAQRSGRTPLDNLTIHLARIEDDQIAEIWFHNFDSPAVAEFWA